MSQEPDNAWKDILHEHFREFASFFFREIHDAIDWREPIEFLDKELQKLIPEALKGKAFVDKLAKVKLLDGNVAWVFLHVEVQGYRDPQFEERMFRYNVRLRERYGREVVSLAVLTDDEPGFRPIAFEHALWGFRLRMEFPVVKLLDFRGQEKLLTSHPNPFAIVVLAHLARTSTVGIKVKYRDKLRLVRLLYRRGQMNQEIRDLLRFLDWILRLPEELEQRIIDRTQVWENQKNMPFLSNVERRGLEKGLKQGLEQGHEQGLQKGLCKGIHEAIALGLELRFGSHSREILESIREITSVDTLRRLVDELKRAPDLESFLAEVARA